MATINNMYIWIESEDISYSMQITENQVETGISLTDHAEREPLELSLSGMLLDSKTTTAYEQYSKLRNWQLACKQVKYVGRNVFTGVITDISKSNDYKVSNGALVSLTLKEIRIANSPYRKSAVKKKVTPKKAVVQKQVVTTKKVTAVYHTTKKGEYLILIAGKYGTTLSNILKLNPNIKNPNLIFIGQKIRVK